MNNQNTNTTTDSPARSDLSSNALLAVEEPFRKSETASSISYKVHVFWSHDIVRIWKRDGEVSWSCGGRDKEEERSDLISANCFSLALADAVQVASGLLANA